MRAEGETPTPKERTKKHYILSLPRTLTAGEVVKQGKRDGYTLSIAHVYTVRSSERAERHVAQIRKAAERKQRAVEKQQQQHRAPAPAPAIADAQHVDPNLVRVLRGAVAEIGFRRAISIIEEDRRAFANAAIGD